MTIRLTRRDLLRIGAGGAGLLALPAMRAALAATPATRLLVVITRQGVPYERWCMRPNGVAPDFYTGPSFDEALSNMAPSDVLTPLTPWFDRMVVVDGLSLVSAACDDPYAHPHDRGRIHGLTGRRISVHNGAFSSTGASIDQVVAESLRQKGQISSVALSTPQINPYTFAGEGLAIQSLTLAPQINAALFTDVAAGGSATGDLILRDHITQMDRLMTRLPTDARWRVEAQRDLLRDLADQMTGLPACTPEPSPMEPSMSFDRGVPLQVYEDRIRAAVALLACNWTPVVTLSLSDMAGDAVGLPGADLHFDYAHFTRIDPASNDVMTEYAAVHAGHIASLCAQLSAVPTINGSLLDETLVVWIPECADGGHALDGWPALMVGGPALRGGRYLRFAPESRVVSELDGGTIGGMPHQRLLTTIGRAMGLSIDSFGDTTVTDRAGTVLDTTGWLQGALR